VQAYVGKQTAQGMRPYHWYKHHVLSGAREHALPAAYIRALERIEALDDPDAERHQREMAIHVAHGPLAGAK
ncbi:MAG: gamma-glutamylcyclotransferase family protein, partial [Pseudomonadota bacterium]